MTCCGQGLHLKWTSPIQYSGLQNIFTICDRAFTFMHLADAFIQSDLQCTQAIPFFYQYVGSLGIQPTTFCAANTMLYL